MQELTANSTINPKYAEPLIELCNEAFNANETQRPPNYDKMYGILDRALYPGGDHSKRIVFDWLTDEENVIARKIPMVPIQLNT